MSLHTDLKNQLKDAMRAKDAERLAAIRAILCGFTYELIPKMRKPDEMLTDDETLPIVKRLVKQRKDSIEQFTKGGRAELAVAEEAELKILLTFLPAQMSEADIKKIAEEMKQKLGVTDKSKLGPLMGAVMRETKGRADGLVVKKVVEGLRSEERRVGKECRSRWS